MQIKYGFALVALDRLEIALQLRQLRPAVESDRSVVWKSAALVVVSLGVTQIQLDRFEIALQVRKSCPILQANACIV